MTFLMSVLFRRLTRGDGARRNAAEAVAVDEAAQARRRDVRSARADDL